MSDQNAAYEYMAEKLVTIKKDDFRWTGGYSFRRLHCGFGVQQGRPESCLQHGRDPCIELNVDKEEGMSLLSTLQSHAIQLGTVANIEKTAWFYKLMPPGWKAKALAEEEGKEPRTWFQLRVVITDTTKFWSIDEGTERAKEKPVRTTIAAITPHSIISLSGSEICAEYTPINQKRRLDKSYIRILRLVPSDILVHKQPKYDPFHIDDDEESDFDIDDDSFIVGQ